VGLGEAFGSNAEYHDARPATVGVGGDTFGGHACHERELSAIRAWGSADFECLRDSVLDVVLCDDLDGV